MSPRLAPAAVVALAAMTLPGATRIVTPTDLDAQVTRTDTRVVAASADLRHVHSSEAYPQDAAMKRCRAALLTVTHLPLRHYRMSCAPALTHGNSGEYTTLVGGNTYRTSADIVIGDFLAPAAFERIVKHEAVHGYTIENPAVARALERWAYPGRAVLTGDILDDPAPYPRQPAEVFAAAWARCHGAGPDPVIEDRRMSCADADRIAAAR